MQTLALTCHPSTPCSYVSAIGVRVERVGEDRLLLGLTVEGDLDRLQVPSQRRARHADGLWRHTCFEAFIKQRGATRDYVELNFSPSSEWAIYGFDDYRRARQLLAPPHPPKIVCRRGEAVLAADVDVHLRDLFPGHARIGELRLGIAAVLEDTERTLSYWAIRHPAERADFHHPDSFVLALPQPGAAS